jgi:hypothetical protein
MSALLILGGIAWDPTIAGALVVATGVATFMGSIWLILSTNTGIRVGTLISFAAFFGWMTILAVTWWMYGSGWKGESPSWQVIDINVGDLGQSALLEARLLPNLEDLKSGYELVLESGDATVMAEFATLPSAADNPDLSDTELAALQASRQLRNETITHSELATVAPNVTDAAGFNDFNGWHLLATTQAGDAQAQAIADILNHPSMGFTSSADFKMLDTYTTGGKPTLQENPNRLDRITHWITSSARLTHPVRYTVVQLQEVVHVTVAPGEIPTRPVIDEAKPVVSVIMVRDLGSVRLRPALVALGSLFIFIALCYWLHVRDKEVMARREEFEKNGN